MRTQRSVLVVDRSEETREVLSTALAGRGLRVFSAARAWRGLELAREHRPKVIVVDLEVESTPAKQTAATFARQSADSRAALVVLGRLQPGETDEWTEEIVAKPYHYGPLIRRIEELLDRCLVET